MLGRFLDKLKDVVGKSWGGNEESLNLRRNYRQGAKTRKGRQDQKRLEIIFGLHIEFVSSLEVFFAYLWVSDALAVITKVCWELKYHQDE